MTTGEATFGEEARLLSMTDRDKRPMAGSASGRRRLGMVAAMLLAVASVFVWVFQAAGFQRYVVDSWLVDLERRSGLHMEMAGFSWKWPARLAIEDVQIQVEGRQLLRCERAEVTFGPLWRKPFWRVTDLVLDYPVFYLEKDALGRWKGEPPVPRAPEPGPSSLDRTGISSPTITVKVHSGSIFADQDGQRVLSVGNISGQLTVPYDGGVGVGSLVANLDRLRPAAPRVLTLRGGNTSPRD
jgi:hypothetical protein